MLIELPGLFDLQVNGFGGVDFNSPGLTPDRAGEALERMRASGVTRCLPTLVTSPAAQAPRLPAFTWRGRMSHLTKARAVPTQERTSGTRT